MPQQETPTAIALLKADHRAVEALFEQYESARTAPQKEKLAQQICTALVIHTMIEEEIFYPACRDAKVDDSLLDESYVEHDGAKVMIAEIMAASPEEDFYDAKVKVLSEEIKHHVGEEEHMLTGLFSQAKRADLDMDALGAQMSARKQELQAQFAEEGLPPPVTRTLQGAELEYGAPVGV